MDCIYHVYCDIFASKGRGREYGHKSADLLICRNSVEFYKSSTEDCVDLET